MNIETAKRAFIASTFAIAAVGGFALLARDSELYLKALAARQGVSKPATAVEPAPTQVEFARPETEKQKECIKKGAVYIVRDYWPHSDSNSDFVMKCS